jgi:hypothetical protein
MDNGEEKLIFSNFLVTVVETNYKSCALIYFCLDQGIVHMNYGAILSRKTYQI